MADQFDTGAGGGSALDVVGIGALNIDYIADLSASGAARSARLAALVGATGSPLEWGTERRVDAHTVHAAIDALNSTGPTTALGGSAFNAITAIAQTQIGLRLGYVGVAGRVPIVGVSSVAHLDALGVDRRFVRQDTDVLCGVCLSCVVGGDRTLLTHVGANERMADYLESDLVPIAAYLASARVVHVTSFLDDRTAGRLLAVLREAKRLNPALLISFDPGHVWSVDPDPDVAGILEISDYLLVNYREFRELGGGNHGGSDDETAAAILRRMSGDRAVVVVKRPGGILSSRAEDGKVTSDFYPQAPLPSDEIEDSTGAGDVFAAGLLTVLTCDRLQVELGSLLGMRLARHKLRYVGASGHGQFAEVTRDFIRSLDAQRRATALPRGVFIAHGSNPEWLAVRRFVEERFGLPVYSFESGSWGGRQVTEALAEYLERCGLAICVLNAEDFAGDGRRLARQNVIHEVGLFQGRHGFDRVVVLVEQGCDFVPYAAAPNTIWFPRNGVHRAFFQLDTVIRTHGFAGEEY